MKEEELRFCMEPGGEELGVMICARETGEVLWARGDTGVGHLLGVILDLDRGEVRDWTHRKMRGTLFIFFNLQGL